MIVSVICHIGIVFVPQPEIMILTLYYVKKLQLIIVIIFSGYYTHFVWHVRNIVLALSFEEKVDDHITCRNTYEISINSM